MKNLILVSIIGSLLFLGTNQSFAQNKGQEKKEEKREKAQEKQNKAQDKMDSVRPKSDKGPQDRTEKMSKGNPGNAYGKNKGDMTGKEFGQYRAEMAQNKSDDATTKLSKTDSILNERRENLKRLKESLEEDASMPNTDKKEIEERRERISKAEEKLSSLEALLNESRERLKRTERALDTITQNK